MTLEEFAALKVGDKIENLAFGTAKARVVEVTGNGVRIEWDGSSSRFFHHVSSTAWMHWSKVKVADEAPFMDCMCGRGDAPCPGPDGKPLCFVNDKTVAGQS